MSSRRPLVSHAGRDVSFSFVKKIGISWFMRLILGAGVRNPFIEPLCLTGKGVCNAWVDCAWRRAGVQLYFGILEGEISSLMREREGVCLSAEASHLCWGVRESSAKAVLREMLRLGWPVGGSLCGVEVREWGNASCRYPKAELPYPPPLAYAPEC